MPLLGPIFVMHGVMAVGAKEVERGRIECRRWKIISGRGWERAGSRSVRRDVRSVGLGRGLR